MRSLKYLDGGSLQSRFDPFRNHEDVGLPLRGRVREVRLLRLPIGKQDSDESATGHQHQEMKANRETGDAVK